MTQKQAIFNALLSGEAENPAFLVGAVSSSAFLELK
jgi:hypothetical protein